MRNTRWNPARLAGLVLATSMAACATARVEQAGPPEPATAAQLAQATTPTRQLHVIFDWNMRDRDARLSGRGVLRLDRADRARVDLFDPRGLTLLAAIVEGERMRIVPAAAEVMLPPPALLWSALGSFRPPADAPLVGTSRDDGRTLLDYARDGSRWRFRFENEALRQTEWTAPGGRRTVDLTGSASFGLPEQTTFRDHTEFRELTLRLVDVEETTGFSADAWILPGQ